jgi:hypothetical protein
MRTHQVGNVTVLFKFHSGKLSHVGPGGGIRYGIGATDNVSPQRYHFLPLDELKKPLDMLVAMNVLKAHPVESKRVLSSRLQPGKRLRGYRSISAQHPLVSA